MPRPKTLAIVGGGFTSVSLVVNLHRNSRRPFNIVLLSKRDLARGVAYSTPFEQHLLNVPAGNMSAFPDLPNDLVDWLRKNPIKGSGSGESPEGQFIPRGVYGDYVQSLYESTRQPSAIGTTVETVNAELVAVESAAAPWRLRLSNGDLREVDGLVLATGNEAPSPLLPGLPEDVVLSNPWDWDRLGAFTAKTTALLVGTGLTMVDVALAFAARSEDFKLIAISNHGLYPQAHKRSVPPTRFRLRLDDIGDPDAVFRQMWQHLCQRPDEDWRAVCDALRPHTQDLWQAWTVDGRRTFLRDYAPYWGVRRHRIAPEIAEQIDGMVRSGKLEIRAGKLADATIRDGSLTVAVQRPDPHQPAELFSVDGVINCTGPASPLAKNAPPLFRSLLKRGLVRSDPLGLSIDVNENDEVLDAHGQSHSSLWAVGPLSKAASWEIIAVPDIRNQTQRLCRRLCAQGRR